MAEPTRTRPYRMRERAASFQATRDRIVDATIEIGDPRVPLARIAEEAGVSERTILRHFGNRNGLLAAAIKVANERIGGERFAVPAGDADAAADNLVAHYERIGDQVLARLAEEGSDERLDRVLDSGRALHRRWVDEKLGPLLGELDERIKRRRIAQLVAVCDVYTWKLLRRDQGLGIEETRRAIAELIRGVTEGGEQ
jgi:AcrR family transcriptional regulator